MMEKTNYKYRHILLSETAHTEKFTGSGRGSKLKLPRRDWHAHRDSLLSQLEDVNRELEQLKKQRKNAGIASGTGITLDFESEPGFDLKFDSLDLPGAGIELLSVNKPTESNAVTRACVFVPEGKLKIFEKKINDYGSKDKDTRKGNHKNQPLVESISSIYRAEVEKFWTDQKELFPKKGEKIWWEVWLRREQDGERNLEFFREKAPVIGLKLKEESIIHFPDRTVVLAYGSRESIARAIDLLNCIAELRKAKDNPEFFMNLSRSEQLEWTNETLERIESSDPENVSICLLDTGVNRKHLLIENHLSENDIHAYKKEWGGADQKGHGTAMAGLAAYGDLLDILSTNERVLVPYRLESVKIIHPADHNEPELYGYITSQCISRAEIEAPERKRIIVMAITTTDSRDRGQPSSWSAALDKVSSGAEDEKRRLIILSAGNTDLENRCNFPGNNLTEGIHDPGQAWNALCVGAYTAKYFIDQNEYPGWKPIASLDDISPCSTTSINWDNQWPIKPDVVFEGGNNAIKPGGKSDNGPDSLGLLAPYFQPLKSLFTIFGDTSAAAAQVARLAALIQVEYPGLWPETIRALLVHSSEWTAAMKKRWEHLNGRSGKEKLLRYCGFGVPDLTRARRSAQNALTLIIQDELFPFEKKEKENRCIFRDMHIHQIPWPTEILEDLKDTRVTMRVTLSYFIEPNPGERGWKTRYKYASHQLSFDVKTPRETLTEFRKRINKKASEKDETKKTESDSEEWELGTKLRRKGSIHSDWWKGTAADLAERSYIGVYPISGWWKEKPKLEKWKQKVRYALVVSIETPDESIDLYTEIVNKIATKITV